MTIDDKITDEKLQYNINKEVAKISALLSGKIGKYEYLTGQKYCLLIKDKQQNKLSLQIRLSVKHLKKNQKNRLLQTFLNEKDELKKN